MGFSRVAIVSPSTVTRTEAKSKSIAFFTPQDIADPLQTLARVLHAVADVADKRNWKELKAKVLEATAGAALLAPEVEEAAKRLRPVQFPVWRIVWAVKKIQRNFRGYGVRRDKRTLQALLGV